MKTTEQILTEVMKRHNASHFDIGMTLCKEAMDEFAKEDAMSFMKWTFDHKWVPNSSFLWWNTELPREDVRFHPLSEIYKAYQQDKSKP